MATIALTIVAYDGKQSFQNLANHGQKKRMGTFGTGENGTNTEPQCTIKIFRMQNDTAKIRQKTPNCPIKVIEDQFEISQK